MRRRSARVSPKILNVRRRISRKNSRFVKSLAKIRKTRKVATSYGARSHVNLRKLKNGSLPYAQRRMNLTWNTACIVVRRKLTRVQWKSRYRLKLSAVRIASTWVVWKVALQALILFVLLRIPSVENLLKWLRYRKKLAYRSLLVAVLACRKSSANLNAHIRRRMRSWQSLATRNVPLLTMNGRVGKLLHWKLRKRMVLKPLLPAWALLARCPLETR